MALGEVSWLLLWTNRNGARVKKNENLGGGGRNFWSVQFKRGLTQVKFASMVVLFRGESLIWFWGRHFFVQGLGGGVAAVPFLNETAVATQYNPPPQSGCSILHNCAESVR